MIAIRGSGRGWLGKGDDVMVSYSHGEWRRERARTGRGRGIAGMASDVGRLSMFTSKANMCGPSRSPPVLGGAEDHTSMVADGQEDCLRCPAKSYLLSPRAAPPEIEGRASDPCEVELRIATRRPSRRGATEYFAALDAYCEEL